MLEYYAQHPLYAVLVIALALLALFVLFKAVKASSRRSKKVNAIIDKMKEENELLNKYSILTADLIASSDSAELFKGVGVGLQKRVSDKADMKAEFDSLCTEQKYIYAMYTFLQDAEEGMSSFFSSSTKPLTSTAAEAVENVASGDFREAFLAEYNATDEDNEEVSYNPDEMAKWDKKAAPSIADGTVCRFFGEYIKQNASAFIPR